MFLKPFRIKGQTSVKGSDRKKIRLDIEQRFPSLTGVQLSELIPAKGEMTQVKISTHAEDHLLVYCVQKIPIFFEHFKNLYPTVYTLWKFPELLPVFTTYVEVFPRLTGGADLMLPGVVVRGEAHPKMFGSLQKGDLCMIRLLGNKAPVALGEALLSGEDMFLSALKGKGVKVIHILGDQLWDLGDRSQPPHIPDNELKKVAENEEFAVETIQGIQSLTIGESDITEREVKEINAETLLASGVNDQLTAEEIVESDESESEEGELNATSSSDMDSLMLYCFKCAIKGRLKKSDLPLLTSTFLRVFMLPYSPQGKLLDVKKSSYKKFSKFLQQMQSEGFIKITEQSRGVDVITDFDRSHPELKHLQVPQLTEAEGAGEGTEEEFDPPVITEVFCVTSATLPLLQTQGLRKGDTVDAGRLRSLITEYVRLNKLQKEDKKDQVQLDPILAELSLTPKESDLEYLTWNDLFLRIKAKMKAACLIKISGKEPVLKKGVLQPIKLEVVQRGSKKKVTLVDCLEIYGVDPRSFAQYVQRGVACSASVVSSDQKNQFAQVVIQGNQISFVGSLLLDKYKIPRKYIEGLEKAPKVKKRR